MAEEESAASNAALTLTDDPTWIIDPIDGTMNFVNQLGFVAISVAITINKELELAILFNPCYNEFYTARKGQGAFLNGQSIHASKSKNLRETLVSYLSFYHPKAHERSLELFKQYSIKSLGVRILGSAALTLAYVAQGILGGYTVRYLKPWDIAAGVLLIREAGGFVSALDGGPIDLMKPVMVSAGNHDLYLQIVDIEESSMKSVD